MFSPDGRAITYEYLSVDRSTQTDVFTFNLVTNTRTQITFDDDNDLPIWSPDGSRILFQFGGDTTDGKDLWVKPADNSGSQELVLSRPGDQVPLAWLTDDRIVFATNEAGNADLFVYSLSGTSEPVPYLQAPWDESEFALHPEGALAAHTSEKTGEDEIWLRDFPTPEGEWRVSVGGGEMPRWSPDGGTLYFWRMAAGADTLKSVRIDIEPSVVVHEPQVVFAMNLAEGWDLHPDGDRFIVSMLGGAASATGPVLEWRYLVVLNWFEELKARMGN